ncbi:MAG TPA: MFS transporter [Candidatus Babeliales bacterium]|nr:MFS transporter [Candidatus Babeliales bacterium]
MFYSPLKSSVYRAVWIVTLFSNIGTWAHTVTSSLLMTKLTTSSTLIALVQTASMLPIFLFAIPAGVIADLISRKTLVIYAQIAMSVLAFSMALVTYLGGMNDILLLTMTFLLNIGLAFNQPAWQALSSTLVPAQDIKQAAALNNLSFNLSRCIGPAIAGYYFSELGPACLFALNGISFLGVIAVFNYKVENDNVNKNLRFTAIKTGFKESTDFLYDYPALKFIFIKSFLYFVLASCLWATLPYIIIVYHHMTDKDLGILTSAAGIGAVLNAYCIYYFRKHLSDSQLTTISMILAGLVMLLFVTFKAFYLYFALMLVFGLSWSLSVSVFNGVLQSEFPRHIRSRLIGIYCVFFAAGQALGSYLSGQAIQWLGLDNALLNISLLTLFIGFCYLLLSNERGLLSLIYQVRNR